MFNFWSNFWNQVSGVTETLGFPRNYVISVLIGDQINSWKFTGRVMVVYGYTMLPCSLKEFGNPPSILCVCFFPDPWKLYIFPFQWDSSTLFYATFPNLDIVFAPFKPLCFFSIEFMFQGFFKGDVTLVKSLERVGFFWIKIFSKCLWDFVGGLALACLVQHRIAAQSPQLPSWPQQNL